MTDISPYLLRPCRTMEQVRREREEQGRTALGTWLPWENFEDDFPSTDRLREQVGMYVSTREGEP